MIPILFQQRAPGRLPAQCGSTRVAAADVPSPNTGAWTPAPLHRHEPKIVEHDTGPWFRRTWIRRSPAEIDQAGRQLASEAREIFDPDVVVFPSPSAQACGNCPFASPCLALYEGNGTEAEAILTSSYRTRSTEVVEGRLGHVTWSTGRGAAPPRFTGRRS